MEAGEKSGALRQADHCIKQGRDILIPYSLLHSSLLWPKKYIQKGAYTFRNIKEVLELLKVIVVMQLVDVLMINQDTVKY